MQARRKLNNGYSGSDILLITAGEPAAFAASSNTVSKNHYRLITANDGLILNEYDGVTSLAGAVGYKHGGKALYLVKKANQVSVPYPCRCGWRGCSWCHYKIGKDDTYEVRESFSTRNPLAGVTGLRIHRMKNYVDRVKRSMCGWGKGSNTYTFPN